MNRFISLLSSSILLANLLPLSALAATSYSGINESNAYADTVISAYSSGTSTEETSDASDSGSNDIAIGKSTNDVLYIGSPYTFDGLALDIDTSAVNGKYSMEYWDGSTWDTLVNETDADLINDSLTGVFSMEWSQKPSDWDQTSVNMTYDESGNSTASSSLYFVRLRITSDYSTRAYASKVGVLVYNLKIDLNTELGEDLTSKVDNISFYTSVGDGTVYSKRESSTGIYEFAFYTPSATAYTYTIDIEGYVEESVNVTLSTTQTNISENIPYAHVLKAYNSGGSEVQISSAKAGTSSETCNVSGNFAYCALSLAEDNSSTATIYADSYAPMNITLMDRSTDSESQAVNSFTMPYAYEVTVTETDGSVIISATVKVGDSLNITCSNLGSGEYGCAVPISETNGNLEISASGYETRSDTFDTVRDDNTDVQVAETFRLESDGTEDDDNDNDDDNDDDIDLDIEEIDLESDGDLTFTVENEGSDDVDSDEEVFIEVYIEGDKEWSESYEQGEDESDFLDGGEDTKINLGDNMFDNYDDGDEVDVEVCVDTRDDLDETDENNNCMEVEIEVGDDDNNDDDEDDDEEDIDLEVLDLYVEDEDELHFVLANTGDEDVDEDDDVYVYIYIDGIVEWSKSFTESSSDNEFREANDETSFDLGDDLLDDEGDEYEVEICVDTKDAIDEEDERNNCMEEDEDELAEGEDEDVDLSSDCSDFNDINNHWGEEYICNLFDRDTVEGRTSTRYEPDEDVTRAEFLKMVLLDAGFSPYSTSGVYYSDVSSKDWYYSYVTYATARGYVEGYTDETFRPNDDISRAEALAILLRVAGEDDEDFDSNDINFWDVDTSDWFAEVVVIANDLDIIDGYSDDSFRPYNDLSRAEAASIVDKAYEEFYN